MNEDQMNEINENKDQEQDSSAREARRQELMGMFNPDRMKVIRKELFGADTLFCAPRTASSCPAEKMSGC